MHQLHRTRNGTECGKCPEKFPAAQEDDMVEVAIAAVEAVFDWRKWQKEENV